MIRTKGIKPDPNGAETNAWRGTRKPEAPHTNGGTENRFDCNDDGNANRLIAAYGRDLIYCPESRGLIVWTGAYWETRDSIFAEKLAEKTLRAAYSELSRITDDDKRKSLFRFLNQSLNRAGTTNMVALARRKAIAVSLADFDPDPFLLNCVNGTVDLRTGKLRGHRQEDRITKMIPSAYTPDAECLTFMEFLYRIMGGNQRLIDFLQLAFGCAATGKPEKVLFMFYGKSGNNGKTTLLEIIRKALGNHQYGGQVQIETLMASAKAAAMSNSINADIADMRGCRYISSSEVDHGQRFNLARLKYLTGLNQLRGRHLGQDFFNFMPTHKLFLDCNDKPIITNPNDPAWNRIKLVPFPIQIPDHEIDTNLPAKLAAELPGILRWIVQGAKRYIEEGLTDIPEVRAATEEYRAESDKLSEFLEDKCLVDLATKNDRGTNLRTYVEITRLYSAYQAWAESTGEQHPLAKTEFDERIERLGCKKGVDPTGNKRVWYGIKFKND